MNQLMVCLPHLQKELGNEAYQKSMLRLTDKMLQHHTAVSEISIVGSENGAIEYNVEENMMSTRGHARDKRALLLTDDEGLADFCCKNHIPYGVLLCSGNRNASFPSGSYCMEAIDDVAYDYLDKIYKRAAGLPWKILETKRLVIREITVQDVERLYELYRDSSITQYMEALFPDIEQERSYTKEYIRNVYDFYGYGMWVIALKSSDTVIGRAGLEYKEGYEGLELGFMIGKEYQHQGYAYEACKAILDYGREELEQESFRAVVHMENEASRRLCERLGFDKKNEIIIQKQKYFEYCINRAL